MKSFFQMLEDGNQECVKRWKEYLEYFAQALANIRLSFDTEIIIGGKLAPYLLPRVEELKSMVASYGCAIHYQTRPHLLHILHEPDKQNSSGFDPKENF